MTATTIVGKDSITSASHIIPLPTVPLLYPAIKPKNVPLVEPKRVAKNPIDNEVLDPQIILDSTSLPNRSVPAICCRLGLAKRFPILCSIGSYGEIKGENIARQITVIANKNPIKDTLFFDSNFIFTLWGLLSYRVNH